MLQINSLQLSLLFHSETHRCAQKKYRQINTMESSLWSNIQGQVEECCQARGKDLSPGAKCDSTDPSGHFLGRSPSSPSQTPHHFCSTRFLSAFVWLKCVVIPLAYLDGEQRRVCMQKPLDFASLKCSLLWKGKSCVHLSIHFCLWSCPVLTCDFWKVAQKRVPQPKIG